MPGFCGHAGGDAFDILAAPGTTRGSMDGDAVVKRGSSPAILFVDPLMRRRRDPRAVAPFIASDMRRIRRAIPQGGPVLAA